MEEQEDRDCNDRHKRIDKEVDEPSHLSRVPCKERANWRDTHQAMNEIDITHIYLMILHDPVRIGRLDQDDSSAL
jgi:hypothetical protein